MAACLAPRKCAGCSYRTHPAFHFHTAWVHDQRSKTGDGSHAHHCCHRCALGLPDHGGFCQRIPFDQPNNQRQEHQFQRNQHLHTTSMTIQPPNPAHAVQAAAVGATAASVAVGAVVTTGLLATSGLFAAAKALSTTFTKANLPVLGSVAPVARPAQSAIRQTAPNTSTQEWEKRNEDERVQREAAETARREAAERARREAAERARREAAERARREAAERARREAAERERREAIERREEEERRRLEAEEIARRAPRVPTLGQIRSSAANARHEARVLLAEPSRQATPGEGVRHLFRSTTPGTMNNRAQVFSSQRRPASPRSVDMMTEEEELAFVLALSSSEAGVRGGPPSPSPRESTTPRPQNVATSGSEHNASARAEAVTMGAPIAEHSDSSGPGICVICIDCQATNAFTSCGHLCACRDCAETIMNSSARCPICRAACTGSIRVFISS